MNFNVKQMMMAMMALSISFLYSCDDDDDDTPAIPDPVEASFTAVIASNNANKVVLTNTTSGTIISASWDVDGGTLIEGSSENIDTAYYPKAGTYTISLTVNSEGGTNTASEQISIAEDEPVEPTGNCADETYQLLAGECGSPKTWIFSRVEGAFGIGPASQYDPTEAVDKSWYTHPEDGFDGDDGCIYDDEFVFSLSDQQFTANDNGDSFFSWAYANAVHGMTQGKFSDTCAPSLLDSPVGFTIEMRDGLDGEQYPYLVFADEGYLAYYEGAFEYQILNVTADALDLRAKGKDTDEGNTDASTFVDNGWRYLSFVAK